MPKYCFPPLSKGKGYIVSPSFIVDKKFYGRVDWLAKPDKEREDETYPVYHVNNITHLSHLILLEYKGEK